jgi:hypothetical protein
MASLLLESHAKRTHIVSITGSTRTSHCRCLTKLVQTHPKPPVQFFKQADCGWTSKRSTTGVLAASYKSGNAPIIQLEHKLIVQLPPVPPVVTRETLGQPTSIRITQLLDRIITWNGNHMKVRLKHSEGHVHRKSGDIWNSAGSSHSKLPPC